MEYWPRSSMLVISTAIGIYVYTVVKEGESIKLELVTMQLFRSIS